MSSLRVAVLGGGRSSEHEVSLASAASIREGLREAGHEPIEIEIGRDGDLEARRTAASRSSRAGASTAPTSCFPALHGPVRRGRDGPGPARVPRGPVRRRRRADLGAVHGQGHVQGADGGHGIPQVDYRAVREARARRRPGRRARRASSRSGCRCSSSPPGSGPRSGSRGWPTRTRCRRRSRRRSSTTRSRSSRRRRAGSRSSARCSATATRSRRSPGRSCSPRARAAGTTTRPSTRRAGCGSIVPPRLPADVIERVRELAVTTFRLVDCSGLARVDFFVERDRVLVNELNTMPGVHLDERVRVAVRGERRLLSRSCSTGCWRSRSSATRSSAARLAPDRLRQSASGTASARRSTAADGRRGW